KIRKAQTLPTLCMRCGAPGALIREHLFHWYSPILYFALLVFFSWPLPYFLFVLCDKRRRVAVPLCEAHQSHWATRSWTLATVLLLCMVVFVALIALSKGARLESSAAF